MAAVFAQKSLSQRPYLRLIYMHIITLFNLANSMKT